MYVKNELPCLVMFFFVCLSIAYIFAIKKLVRTTQQKICILSGVCNNNNNIAWEAEKNRKESILSNC